MTYLGQRIELDPNQAQRLYFAKAAGTARFAYNWALAEWKRMYEAGEKPTAYKVKAAFNAWKNENAPWNSEVSSYGPARAIDAVGTAFKKFFKKQNRYPQFKKKGVCRDSFRVDNGMALSKYGDGFSYSDTHVIIPKLGAVRLKHKPRFVGRTVQAYVSREADRWFISITTDVGENYKREPAKERTEVTGVDLGVNVALVASDGKKVRRFRSPKPLKNNLRRMRRLQRRIARQKKGSNNRKKSIFRLQRLHRRIKNIRKDFTHKATTAIVSKTKIVVLEDLNVKGMLQNNIARSLSDISFAEIRRQIEYKAPLYGARVVIADQFYPSSKLCSKCGWKNADLQRRDKAWTCPACGKVHDRDVNAAQNLRFYIRRVTPESKRVENTTSASRRLVV